MPRDTSEETAARAEALEGATVRASDVPLQVARSSAEVLGLAAEILAIGNRNALSDAGVGGRLAMAAVLSASLNVKANASGLTDRKLAARWLEELRKLEELSEEKRIEIRGLLKDRAEIL